MKKFACIIMLSLFVTLGVNAQIKQGNILVGADIANANLSLDKGGNFSFRIDPKIAWFLRDNLAIGGYFLVGLSTAKGAGTNVDYGIGALARYYLGDPKAVLIRNSRFFFEGNVGIEGNNPAIGDNTNGLGLGIGPGWTYFVTSNIGLEALVKYNGIVGFGSKPTSNNISLGVGLQIYLPASRVEAVGNDLKGK